MDTIPGSGDVNWQRRVIAVVILFLSLPVVLPALFFAYVNWVPPYAATMTVPELRADLTLRFFYVWDVSIDAGRYLTIRAPLGRKTIAMTAFDWAHNSRTSIYRTPDGEIAILGPAGDDYVVSLDTMKVAERIAFGSERWIYLGAFDYEIMQFERRLRFIGADEQAECIPMIGADDNGSRPRYNARRRNCDHYAKRATR